MHLKPEKEEEKKVYESNSTYILKMTNQHFHMHLLLYKVNVYILSLVVFIFSSSSYVSSSRQLYMGINTYDPFTNLEYIFARLAFRGRSWADVG